MDAFLPYLAVIAGFFLSRLVSSRQTEGGRVLGLVIGGLGLISLGSIEVPAARPLQLFGLGLLLYATWRGWNRNATTALILLIPVAAACAPDGDAGRITSAESQTATEVARSMTPSESVDLEAALRTDPDAKALVALSQELLARGAARGITKSVLVTALQTGGSDGAAAAMGFSRYESQRLNDRFRTHLSALQARYPALQSIAAGRLLLPTNDEISTAQLAEEEDEEGPCKWIRFSACLLSCTLGGPVLYWPCAYLCVCTFCPDAPGFDVICEL